MPQDKYIISRDRKVTLSPGVWAAEFLTSRSQEKIHGIRLRAVWDVYCRPDCLQQAHLRLDWESSSNFVAQRLFTDNRYLPALSRRYAVIRKKVKLFLNKSRVLDLKRLSFFELVNQAQKIKNLWLEHDGVNVAPWFLGADKFKEMIASRLRLAEQDFLFLTTPLEKTKAGQLETSMLTQAQAVACGQRKLELAARQLSKEYGWLPFGYDGPTYWNSRYFAGKLRRLVSKKPEAIRNKLNVIRQ